MVVLGMVVLVVGIILVRRERHKLMAKLKNLQV